MNDGTELKMPIEVSVDWYAEEDRQQAAFFAFTKKWPNFRQHAAYAMLGVAIATADMMGIDVEAFLRSIREQNPHPGVLVPPKAS